MSPNAVQSIPTSRGDVKRLEAVVAVERFEAKPLSDGTMSAPVAVIIFSKIFLGEVVQVDKNKDPDEITHWLEGRDYRSFGAVTGDGNQAVVWISQSASLGLSDIACLLGESFTRAPIKFYHTDAWLRYHLGTSLSKYRIQKLRTRNPYFQGDIAIAPAEVMINV